MGTWREPIGLLAWLNNFFHWLSDSILTWDQRPGKRIDLYHLFSIVVVCFLCLHSSLFCGKYLA